MSEMFAYRIQQINDNGQAVQITLVEDVQTCLLYTSDAADE